MTEQQIAALHAQWRTYAGPLEPVIQQTRALLNEVDRWRDIGRTVASGFTLSFDDVHNTYACVLCDATISGPPDVEDWEMTGWDTVGWREQHIQHDADCPVTQARALLAGE